MGVEQWKVSLLNEDVVLRLGRAMGNFLLAVIDQRHKAWGSEVLKAAVDKYDEDVKNKVNSIPEQEFR